MGEVDFIQRPTAGCVYKSVLKSGIVQDFACPLPSIYTSTHHWQGLISTRTLFKIAVFGTLRSLFNRVRQVPSPKD